jgi:hypothetical protein
MDRTWCILALPEWNADKTRVDCCSLLDVAARLGVESICQASEEAGSMEEVDLAHEDSSHNIPTLGCLAGFV